MATKKQVVDGVDIDDNDDVLSKEYQKYMRYGNDDKFKLKLLPLGIPTLDSILGGGLALGQYVLVKGATAAGKTFLLQKVFAAAQAKGIQCHLIDLEKAFNPDWYAANGVDISKLQVIRPPSGEVAFDIALDLIRKNAGVVALDSLAAVSPQAELDKTFGEATVGRAAMLINRLTRELPTEIQDTIFICTNQYRQSIGVSYGDPSVLPGGKGQEYFAWHIIKVARSGWTLEKEQRIGFDMEFTVEKNRQGPPWKKTKVAFTFAKGLSILDSLIVVALEMGIVEMRGGGNYYMDGERLEARGREGVITLLENDSALREAIEKRIKDAN